jgi:hypothetical protein
MQKHTGAGSRFLPNSGQFADSYVLLNRQNLLKEHTGVMTLPLSDGQCVHLISLSHLTKPEITALNEYL